MKPSAVLSQLQEEALTGAISGLKRGDVNKMLYVAEGGCTAHAANRGSSSRRLPVAWLQVGLWWGRLRVL